MDLLETTYSSSKTTSVDEEAGVIRGVKILGRESQNQRVYTDHALSQAARLYEGIKVHVDHSPRNSPDAERSFAEGIGELRGIAIKDDGVYGDLHYLKSHPNSGQLIESAKRMPHLLGLSHNASGTGERGSDGKFVVESVDYVRSVDLVGKPATNRGLFESQEPEPMKTKTVRQIVDGKPDTKWLVQLREQMEAGAIAPEMEVEAEPDPAAEVTAALEKAAVAVVKKLFAGDIEPDAAMAEIKKILGMRDEASSGDGEAPPEGGGDAMESVDVAQVPKILAELQKLKDAQRTSESRVAVAQLLESSGRVATDEQRELLVTMDDKTRKAFLDVLPLRESLVRPRFSPGINPDNKSSTVPEKVEDFVEAILDVD